MEIQTMNEDIIRLVGGKDNISAVVHCHDQAPFYIKGPEQGKNRRN